jgi:hypothetical protein
LLGSELVPDAVVEIALSLSFARFLADWTT